MRQLKTLLAAAILAMPAAARAQQADNSFAITDNSFLVEEAFNQEAHVVQNILFVQKLGSDYNINFTQEWPVGGMTHQLSYTLGISPSRSLALNYRYQLAEESATRPAISPRVSALVNQGPDLGLQLNVPASKQFGDFYIHANAGVTWTSKDVVGQPAFAGSLIYRLRPMLNPMLESLYLAPTRDQARSFVISPGVRGGWNIGKKQIVLGIAVPIGLLDTKPSTSLITYFSYELPFR